MKCFQSEADDKWFCGHNDSARQVKDKALDHCPRADNCHRFELEDSKVSIDHLTGELKLSATENGQGPWNEASVLSYFACCMTRGRSTNDVITSVPDMGSSGLLPRSFLSVYHRVEVWSVGLPLQKE